MRPSGYRRHLYYFHIRPDGQVSIVDTKGGVRMAEQVAYNIDCMEYMRTLPDKAFDLAVVDPPYGIGVDGQKERRDLKNPKHSRKGHTKKDGIKLYLRENISENSKEFQITKLYGAGIISYGILMWGIRDGLYGIRDNMG